MRMCAYTGRVTLRIKLFKQYFSFSQWINAFLQVHTKQTGMQKYKCENVYLLEELICGYNFSQKLFVLEIDKDFTACKEMKKRINVRMCAYRKR